MYAEYINSVRIEKHLKGEEGRIFLQKKNIYIIRVFEHLNDFL